MPIRLEDIKPKAYLREHGYVKNDTSTRHLYQKRKANGIEKHAALLKINGEIFVNVPGFLSWVLDKNGIQTEGEAA